MVMNENVAISVENLSLEYSIFERQRIFSIGKTKTVTALQNISVEVNKGETVALLGRNGAGKTTLLQSIGGHLRPTAGLIETVGRVFSLKGANPGMIPGLTGRENVRLLSQIYGVAREETDAFIQEIEEFCELGEAFDRKLKTLSTGMSGRIGFGFTTSLKPDVLLMDETLGVGDENFRKKAERKAIEFMERGETILLSTHSLNLAKKMCQRGIVLDEGKIVFDGASEEAVKFYLDLIDK